jgi:hypothetical protein
MMKNMRNLFVTILLTAVSSGCASRGTIAQWEAKVQAIPPDASPEQIWKALPPVNGSPLVMNGMPLHMAYWVDDNTHVSVSLTWPVSYTFRSSRRPRFTAISQEEQGKANNTVWIASPRSGARHPHRDRSLEDDEANPNKYSTREYSRRRVLGP